MKKSILFLLSLSLCSIAYSGVALKEFKSNLRLKIGHNYVRVAFDNLPIDDRQAIDQALNKAAPYFAYCNGSLFRKGSQESDPEQEIRLYKPSMLFQKEPLTKADVFNGLSYKGRIIIFYTDGIYRMGLSEWEDLSSPRNSFAVSFIIKNGKIMEGGGYFISPSSENIESSVDQLTCSKIEQKREEAQIRIQAQNDLLKVSAIPTRQNLSYERQPQVQYPEQARRHGDTGTVMVRALVGTNGRVESASVETTSGNRLLDQAALRAVSRASFYPHVENGVAEEVYTLIPISFNLYD